jgi:hypothetical protein
VLPQPPPTSGGTAQSQLSDNARRATLNTLRRAIFLVSLPFGILHFVLPIYGKSIGANAVQIGLFFSVFSMMTVLPEAMGWPVAERALRVTRPLTLV